MMPRFATFIGFQFSLIKDEEVITIIGIVFACIMLILFVGFFAYLVISIRKINAQI